MAAVEEIGTSFKLELDMRETDLIMDMDEKVIQTGALDIGDIQISMNGVPLLIAERKTVRDFAASIEDGRYREQKHRLMKLRRMYPRVRIFYIIEGFNYSKETLKRKTYYKSRVTYGTMLSADISLAVRDGFFVLRTANVEETRLWIEKVYEKIQKPEFYNVCLSDAVEGTLASERVLQEGPQVDYLESIRLKKKDNVSPKNWYTLSLAQIPGVSVATARKIEKVYPTYRDILKAYTEKDTIKEREKMLTPIDKIGAVLSKRIYVYLNNIQE
jgi:ERCC4-type nuclease